MQGDNFEIFTLLFALHAGTFLTAVRKKDRKKKKNRKKKTIFLGRKDLAAKGSTPHVRGGGALPVALSCTTDIVWTPQV